MTASFARAEVRSPPGGEGRREPRQIDRHLATLLEDGRLATLLEDGRRGQDAGYQADSLTWCRPTCRRPGLRRWVVERPSSCAGAICSSPGLVELGRSTAAAGRGVWRGGPRGWGVDAAKSDL